MNNTIRIYIFIVGSYIKIIEKIFLFNFNVTFKKLHISLTFQLEKAWKSHISCPLRYTEFEFYSNNLFLQEFVVKLFDMCSRYSQVTKYWNVFVKFGYITFHIRTKTSDLGSAKKRKKSFFPSENHTFHLVFVALIKK